MTIEERAFEKYDRSFEREAYCDGATDQLKIDIEKAFNAYCKNCQNAIKTMKGVDYCRKLCK